MIAWEDDLFGHKYYAQGAIGLLKCYLEIDRVMKIQQKSKEEEQKLLDVNVKEPMVEAEKVATKALKFHVKNLLLNEAAVPVFIDKGIFMTQSMIIN